MPTFLRRALSGAVALLLAACAGAPAATAPSAHAPIEVPAIARPAGETAAWWFRAGAAAAAANAIGAQPQAKNVIVFLGDGMSIPTIAAAHVFAGQRLGVDGESYRLSFERFPFTALSRTYETNLQTPDSAGTMTAIMTGVKTQAGFIGVDQAARRGDCASAQGHELVTALELAKLAGQSVGAITTTRVTHATPAATYGHLPERNWEVDAELPAAARAAGCKDFAAQLVDFPIGDGLNVAMGGGRSEFLPAGAPDPEYPGKAGRRRDRRDLTAAWLRKPASAYVWNARQLAALDYARVDHLLGLFEPSHMRYEHERAQDPAGEPSLAEMTRAALRVLQKNPRGYFLMVEGGRIDHALHAGNAYRALDETVAFADAVQAAVEMTSADDTLIVVTADHSHTMTFAGYPARGNPILGLVRGPADSYDEEGGAGLTRDALGLPYTTLGFASGPGYTGATDRQPEGPKHFPHEYRTAQGIRDGRPDLAKVDTADPDYLQEATHPMPSETHGGEDVAIFARGPGAAAFHGELEQNAIFHVITQHDPAIRGALCRLGGCDADGVPVSPPSYRALLDAAGR
ncbi:alkaline phosphatase [Mizugakiibacter sediminis]|nr:alkaline phosphatase [Mizugakiibacter sediminis]